MSVAVVYLGEHYVLDVLTGWSIAWISWYLARQWVGIPHRNVLRATNAIDSSQAPRKDVTIPGAGSS